MKAVPSPLRIVTLTLAWTVSQYLGDPRQTMKHKQMKMLLQTILPVE